MSKTEALKMARDALARIDVATVGAEATNSRDLDDWRDDIDGIQRIARAAIAAIDALAQQPAASGEPVAHVAEVGPAWSLVWAGAEPLAHVLARHPGVRIGSKLYDRPQPAPARVPLTYSSTQATNCAGCGQHKHTPLRIDAMGGYVCLTCVDKKLGTLLGEFGYPAPQQPLHITHLTDWLAPRFRAAGGKAGITDVAAWAEEVMRWTEAQHGITAQGEPK